MRSGKQRSELSCSETDPEAVLVGCRYVYVEYRPTRCCLTSVLSC